MWPGSSPPSSGTWTWPGRTPTPTTATSTSPERALPRESGVVKVDLMLMEADLGDMPALARDAEGLGYARLLTTETKANPFLPLVLAAEHTDRIELGTCVAMAFTRSPLHLAHLGHDLQRYSGGRFVLGLGSQVKAHVERRY